MQKVFFANFAPFKYSDWNLKFVANCVLRVHSEFRLVRPRSLFFEKKWKIEKRKIQILRISNERRLMLKKNEILKFEKIEICVFQQQPWDSVENFEKWKLSQKIDHADINLKISTKNGPQKLFDIKIHTPGADNALFLTYPELSTLEKTVSTSIPKCRASILEIMQFSMSIKKPEKFSTNLWKNYPQACTTTI